MPVRNEAAHLRDAVAAVLTQEYPGPWEICLAVGPSTDGTEQVAADLAARDPRIKVVDNPAGITPTGLNAAIAATTGEVVVRVDGHCSLSPGYIATAVEILQTTGAANVGGVQAAVGDGPLSLAVAVAMTSPFGTGGGKLHLGGQAGPVDTVYLGVFRRNALEEVGCFAPDLIRNQDYELNIRLRSAGHHIWFDPRLRVQYTPRGTWSGLARQYFDYGHWKWIVARRHPGSLRPRQVIPAAVTAVVILGLITMITGPMRRFNALAPVGYLATVLTAAATATTRSGTTGSGTTDLGIRMHLLGVFPVMHLAWGLGFWRSALTEIIGRVTKTGRDISSRDISSRDISSRDISSRDMRSDR
jgi:succinoglycan biosynthesis protein ExoA